MRKNDASRLSRLIFPVLSVLALSACHTSEGVLFQRNSSSNQPTTTSSTVSANSGATTQTPSSGTTNSNSNATGITVVTTTTISESKDGSTSATPTTSTTPADDVVPTTPDAADSEPTEPSDLFPVRDPNEHDFDISEIDKDGSGWTFVNTDIVDGKIILIKDEDGKYAKEGFVDIPVNESFDPSGKTVVIKADRINSLADPGFDDEKKIYSYKADSACGSCNKTDKGTGKWFSPAQWGHQMASVTADPDDSSNSMVKLERNITIEQIVPVTPGDDYTISFDYDTSRLADEYYTASSGEYDDQILVVGIKFLNEDFHTLEYLDPGKNTNAQFSYVAYLYREEERGSNKFKIRAIDCDDHAKYEAGTGLYPSDVTFNFCGTGGAGLSIYDDSGAVIGTNSGETDIRYLSFYVLTNWFGTNSDPADDSGYYALVDNFKIDRNRQIEAQIFGASGSIVQQETGTNGFYVDEADGLTTMRVYLRSEDGAATPGITRIAATDAPVVEVAALEKTAEFDEPRLGNLWTVGPRTDVMNEDIGIRSLCLDPETEELDSCVTAWKKYGLTKLRYPILQSFLTVEKNGSGDYEFSFTEDGETILKRLIEFENAGIDVQAGIIKIGGFYYDRPTDSTVKTYATAIDDIVGDCSSSDAAKESCYELLSAYARHVADLFDGKTEYTFQYVDAGTTVTLPLFEWEIFNEDNITETDWMGWNAWGSLLDLHEDAEAARIADEMAGLSNRLAQAVLEANPAAEITFTGLASHYGPVFALDDLALLMNELDTEIFTGANFHPYSSETAIEDRENLILERWEATQTALQSHGFWDGKDVFFTEYGETIEIYDPSCTYDATSGQWKRDDANPNMAWSRGYGQSAYAELIARETITLLSLPARSVKPYGLLTQENESAGRYANADGSGGYECWHSDSLYNFNLTERIEGTGVLSGKDEPSQYRLNKGGLAYALIGKYLSANGSTPYRTKLESTDDLVDVSGEYYNAFLFGTGTGETVLAIWWYDTYTYTYESSASWMNYYTGVADDGFTGKRKHAIKITSNDVLNLGDVKQAKLVRLDGSDEEELTIGKDDDGNVYVYDAVFGGTPVLIVLE